MRTMKYLFAFISGFFLTLVIFVSGAAVTIVYLTAEPVPVRQFNASYSGPWSNEPVRVSANREALPKNTKPAPAPAKAGMPMQAQAAADEQLAEFNAGSTIDPMESTVDPITASAVAEPTFQPASQPDAAHVAWCLERYRSYNPGDNRYTAYSGERRECVSPFSETSNAFETRDEPEQLVSASSEESSASDNSFSAPRAPASHLDPAHIQSCFARYRSYRPEDNTYQPYGGGPRRQCE